MKDIFAYTENIPIVDEATSLDLIKNEFPIYFNGNWKLFQGHGIFGMFVHQAVNGMIQFPKIYLLEFYQFNRKESGINKADTIIVAWRYDTEGNITNEVCLTKKENYWSNVRKEIKNDGYITLSNGDTVFYTEAITYNEIKEIVDEEIKQINSQLN